MHAQPFQMTLTDLHIKGWTWLWPGAFVSCFINTSCSCLDWVDTWIESKKKVHKVTYFHFPRLSISAKKKPGEDY